MIRREHLGLDISHGDNATVAAEAVQRGQSVRIVGLGTLAVALPGTSGEMMSPPPAAYRLTLTAVMSRYFAPGFEAAATGRGELLADVRHLARALGAPVEVWSPGKCVRGGCGPDPAVPTLLTTVSP